MTLPGKCVWTDADFEQMGWHDASLYAVAVDWDAAHFPDDGAWRGADVLFDIDYIVGWVDPPEAGGNFSFWVAPATLVFEDAWSLEGSLDLADNNTPQILDLRRVARDDHEGERWLWEIEGDQFDLRFVARGFSQHFRRQAAHVSRQRLIREERGRPTFDRPSAFPA